MKPKKSKLQLTCLLLDKANQTILELKENIRLSKEIIFHLVKAAHTGKYEGELSTIYNVELPKEFGTPTITEFHWEISRNILTQRDVIAAGQQVLLNELPTLDMSPIYGKG
jgi:hypothetical protein